MSHIFDADKRARFFDSTFAPVQFDLLKSGQITHLHARDQIALGILGALPAGCRVLDYGCGQGRLLAELLNRGYDAYGYEPSAGMAGLASEHFLKGREDRLLIGAENQLAALHGQQYDVVLLMGVTQYLSDAEYREVFARCRAFLKPGGRLLVTFQNGLFDLFTFNKYTVDAIVHMLMGGLLSEQEQATVTASIERLLTHPTLPAFSENRARDSIFVRLSNPLTIADDLRDVGFDFDRLWFYEWFGLPPLLTSESADLAARIKAAFEVTNAQDWRGHFMANAFLVVATPRM